MTIITIQIEINRQADKNQLIKDIDTNYYTLLLKDISDLDNIKAKVIDRVKQEYQDKDIKIDFIV